MLCKILAFGLATSMATLPLCTNVLAWGCGGWSRSGSATFTGRYGNTYSGNWSRSGGFGAGGWNRSGYGSITGPYGNTYSRSYYGSGYYGGGFRGGYVSGPYGSAYVGGVYRRPYW
jgi:DNA helicase II / ATP-dependent DNA helicase PcrA